MFSILSYQGNASQNNTEIPPYTSQNGSDEKLRGQQQMLERMWGKRNTSPLVGLQAGKTTLKISLAIPQKIRHSTT